MMTIQQVASRFDVHERTVRRWIERGLITVIRIGRTVRITGIDQPQDK